MMKKTKCTILAVLLLATILGGIGIISAFAESRVFDNKNVVRPQSTCVENDLVNYSYKELEQNPNVKKNIFNNMLNSIDFYDSVEGTIETTFAVPGETATVVYCTDIPGKCSYERITGQGTDLEFVCFNDTLYKRNQVTGEVGAAISISQLSSYPRTQNLDSDICIDHGSKAAFSCGDKVFYDRVVVGGNGEKSYYYRPDLTNTAIAQQSIFPQAIVMATLYDLDSWKICSVESYLGRSAIEIEGIISDEEYSDKILVDRFKMIVDITTGIMLDFEGFSPTGELSQFIRTTDIRVYRNGSNNNMDVIIQAAANDIKTLIG
jgi:hypothetical protein